MQRRKDAFLDSSGHVRPLEQRIERCGDSCLLVVAAERMGMADLAGRKPHGRPRHGRFPDIERCAASADASAHGGEPGFRTAQQLGLCGKLRVIPQAFQLSRGRGGQQCHRALSRRLPTISIRHYSLQIHLLI